MTTLLMRIEGSVSAWNEIRPCTHARTHAHRLMPTADCIHRIRTVVESAAGLLSLASDTEHRGYKKVAGRVVERQHESTWSWVLEYEGCDAILGYHRSASTEIAWCALELASDAAQVNRRAS